MTPVVLLIILVVVWVWVLFAMNCFSKTKKKDDKKIRPESTFMTKHKNAKTPRLCYNHLEGRSSRMAVVVNPRYCQDCVKKIV